MGKKITKENSLAMLKPELLKEWNVAKNGRLTPFDVSYGSTKKVWWICEKGHEWESTCYNRSNGRKCPECAKLIRGDKRARAEKDNCLATHNSILAKEWHPTRNGYITPYNIKSHSGKKVWWKCEKGHEWQASCDNRNRGHSCPYCSGRKASIENCLARINPKIAKQWNKEKNSPLTPFDVTPNSNKKFWWVCEKGHEWKATCNSRNSGNRCPYCNGQKACLDNCIATMNPKVSEEWNYKKNGKLSPLDITPHSNQKIWWICRKGHEWEATPNSRSRGTGCPICNSYTQTSFAEQAIYYYLKQLFFDAINRYKYDNKREIDIFIPSKNLAIEYDGQFYHKDRKQQDFKKKQHIKSKGYTFIRILEEVRGKHGSVKNDGEAIIHSYYSGNTNEYYQSLDVCIKQLISTIQKSFPSLILNIKVNSFNDRINIQNLRKKEEIKNSFGHHHPELINEWHDEKNGELTPYSISRSSSLKVWWICEKGHEWEATCGNRSKGCGCPYCNGKKVNVENSLAMVNPTLAKEWNNQKNGELTPFKITANSGKKVWWICEKGHEWQAVCSHRNGRGSRCPYCSGRNSTRENCLATENPTLTKEWHTKKNDTLSPYDVTPNSSKKVWWICKKGHEWQASCDNRNKGHGCPYCSGMKASLENCLATIYPKLVKEWHSTLNGEVTPNDVTAKSNKIAWWKCQNGHDYDMPISDRSKGSGCPYCSGKRVCGDNSLATINPKLAQEWNLQKNGELTPNTITPNSHKKVWWKCEKGHEWQAVCKSRNLGTGCPECYKLNRSKNKRV